jgi:hypothetical protein
MHDHMFLTHLPQNLGYKPGLRYKPGLGYKPVVRVIYIDRSRVLDRGRAPITSRVSIAGLPYWYSVLYLLTYFSEQPAT